ncbi:hypothetical protein SAMN05421819_1708 [Bryocella elongata]|uniref:Glycosyl hydrolase family 79, N-terminal domain n=1 Tax=Bryocella elongata TaxID=863522 RepID=A0A1H5WSK7_9BACT|nr:hypothetical protein [Bryocella elongata]SEG01977.1 hypothetical protein SAMN05421819_1708 [Bryocella elongata]
MSHHHKPRNRREFLQLSGAALSSLALPSMLHAQDPSAPLHATLAVFADPIFTIPTDFTGLSYEAAQLANPAFFAPSNKELVQLFRQLSPSGVLRIGGGTSEYTTYSDAAPTEPTPFEVFGPDTDKTNKKGTVTTARALENLRGFLDATGWSCLYGLNLGQGTKENAVNEAMAAHRILGPRLVALQIGNEPDSFRNRFRPASYTPEDFVREWSEFREAIVAKVPDAKFAGPDISNKLPYLTAFADVAMKHKDVVMLTGHYYAMGPAGRPDATIANLLSEEPKSTTMKWSGVATIQDAMKKTGLPYRISEGNSCWNGGQRGVSDTFASALWCADAMLRFASYGFGGVYLHGGGNGIYSPIVGAPSTGIIARPEYSGMQFAQRLAGATLMQVKLDCDDNLVRAYAARAAKHAKGIQHVALINKSNRVVEIGLPKEILAGKPWQSEKLSAPAIDATSDTTLAWAGKVTHPQTTLRLEPYTALHLARD